jgi:hypothetical protein
MAFNNSIPGHPISRRMVIRYRAPTGKVQILAGEVLVSEEDFHERNCKSIKIK